MFPEQSWGKSIAQRRRLIMEIKSNTDVIKDIVENSKTVTAGRDHVSMVNGVKLSLDAQVERYFISFKLKMRHSYEFKYLAELKV